MVESRSSTLLDKINGLRLSGKSRRTSAPDILTQKGVGATTAASLEAGAAAAPLRRASTTAVPTRRRSSKRESGSHNVIQQMDPNDIIKMLEMHARNADSEVGMECLQALKQSNTEDKKVRRSSKKKVGRTQSLDEKSEDESPSKPRRSSKKKASRTKSVDDAADDKSWGELSVDDL